MQNCWTHEPDERPSIGQIIETLGVSHQVQLGPYIIPKILRQSAEQGFFLTSPPGFLERDSRLVPYLAISSDSKRFAYGSEDRIVRVWDVETDKVSRFRGHTSHIEAIAFSPNGLRVVSGAADGTVRVAELEGGSGTSKQLIALFLNLWSVAFSPDGQDVVVGSSHKIYVINASSGSVRTFLSHGGVVHSVTFSPSGELLAACSEDAIIRVWDLQAGANRGSWGQSMRITTIAFSPDARYIAAGSGNGMIVVRDLQTVFQKTMRRSHPGGVCSVAFSPDGKHLASIGYSDGSIIVWQARTGLQVSAESIGSASARGVAYSPDGKYIVAAFGDGKVRAWPNIYTGLLVPFAI
jgi:WD40 repeat protein